MSENEASNFIAIRLLKTSSLMPCSAVDPNVDSPRPSAENPGAVDPKVDSPRPSAENFSPYIEKKSFPPERGRSKFGFSAPERRKSGRGNSKVDSPRPSAEILSPI